MINSLVDAGTAFLTFSGRTVKQYPKRITAFVAALLLAGGGGAFAVATLAPDASELPVREVLESVPTLALNIPSDLDLQTLKLFRSEVTRSSDTADTLLSRLGVDDASAAAFLRSDTIARQILLGRNGRNVTAETDDNNHLLKLSARWSPEDNGNFNRLVLEKTPQGFQSRIEIAALTASSRLASGTIQSSLFAATDDAKIPDSIATQLAEIFSGDIDFHRALRKGDRFSVVYETLEGDGEPLRTGRVLSAEFVNNGKTFQAMWFKDSVTAGAPTADASRAADARGKGGYYTLDGQSLRRAFLASPMEFSRITSGFKMRFHPILQTMRAHQGVDYGAPTGTPVRSVGDGVVEFAGVQNGYGNVIILKHRNNYNTVYAHLSRINVRKGASVSQGQTIGAVGATGWATGPHLHFEFRVNGVYRDPLTIARQSESIPVSASAKPMFTRLAAENRIALAAAASVQQSSAQ
ncbi:MAG: peptidoglycan DD-metalloendopeptidase family protein [Rhodoferax sp.]|uniref:M23 family metallopeptidase n=1 Tax=Rhodoferax sp. TaxID=50421 RepID=UPI00262319BD|nr:M23 family metallopeptidase [Rhodoferax sp.]MDD5332421.1 peptidoglycan DD-metalloendopeptidase family protein [Rhodoferax sp.]